MTDARLPERWLSDRRFLRLSAEAHLLYTRALMFAVTNRTDGLIHDDDLALIPGVDPARAGELAKTDLWLRHGDGWLIADYEATQTSRHELEVLENVRRRDREKKARQRADQSSVPRDSTGGQSPGTAQERLGKERLGKARRPEKNNAGTVDAANGHRNTGTEDDDWNLVEPPSPLDYEDETA